MSEGDQSGVAHGQIQADREQGEDDHLGKDALLIYPQPQRDEGKNQQYRQVRHADAQ